jgi:quercetin dioxygenase-like cupin family protein
VIENRRTGERIDFAEDTPDRLVMEATWPRSGRRTGAHAHPRMEERWTVLEGRAAFRIGDAPQREAGPGETVVAPPGTVHEAFNASDSPARVRIEMRPALRWREFVERLFAGEDPRALVAEFPDEIRV